MLKLANLGLTKFTTLDPGSQGATGLYYELRTLAGAVVGSWYTDYYGSLQTAPLTLPGTGTYTLRVSYNYGYEGEYRFQLSLSTPPLQRS